MSGSAPGRGASGGARPEKAEENVGDRALFDAVLRETETAFIAPDPDGSALIADLRQVARTRTGEPFDVAIGADMVRVLLDRQVSRMVSSSRLWRQVCQRVASTLCEDPVGRERLERLWRHLQGKDS
jgi:hypothetical protein